MLREQFLELVSDFKEADRNFIFHFLPEKTAKNCETISAHMISIDLIIRTVKKIFI